ncbi:MAG: ABC-F family ATP-binding cassette domain-containing protein [Firmicutes bacterium]|nr:ABC-F family ATP-binding cassette domain-containing protein [Bacillota bacterium]
MNLFSATEVSKTYGDKVLMQDLSFGIEEGERIGVIGINGTGKSTLLRLVAGLDTPDSGRVAVGRGVRIQYLSQDPTFAPDLTVQEALLCAAPDFEVQALATRLGILDFTVKMGTLSGGQQKRVALARVLADPSDLLVLDEPTNHIDHQTVLWLEDFLRRRSGTLLMVTHDRYFLERVVNRIFELDRGQLFRYPGNYETFLEEKARREESEIASSQKRQNFLRNELAWIKRGPRARGTKQKARTDRYFEALEQTTQAPSGALDLWNSSSRLGQTVIELEHVSKSFTRPLIQDFTYRVGRKDRLGIVGPSGCGKSTLLKMMAGLLPPDEGEVIIGATVKLGYNAQEQAPVNANQRVIEYVREEAHYIEAQGGQTITAAQMLERFLFPSSVQWTPLGQLSGGERRRLALLRILISAPNVLLLDEPTNDLDLSTLAVLENYLEDFSGAVIVVSHDRYFVDRVCDTVLVFEGNGQITTHLGELSDYLTERLASANEQEKEKGGQSRGSTDTKPDKVTTTRALRFTYQEQKDYETIDAVIDEVEVALSEVTQKLAVAGNDYDLTQRLYAEQQTLAAKLEGLIDRWTYLQERAEAIAKQKS